jgi:uncharacterized protein (TIGR03437 family)
VRLLSAATFISCCAFGQTYTIRTFAGGGMPVNVPGISASLSSPNAVAADAAGNLFISDEGLNVVLRLDAATGVLTVVAGNGTYGSSGDGGPATSAQLANPSSVAVDAAGNLYIAQINYPRIRKVSNGTITTVAGIGSYGYNGDNIPAVNAQLSGPRGVAVDSAGNLYIADYGNSLIRKVSNGVITSVAGTGVAGYNGDNGPVARVQLKYPAGVTVDASGNLYIADTGNCRIRQVSNGVMATVAGSAAYGYAGDNGPAVNAQLNFPNGVGVDSAGNLYIADTLNYVVRKVSDGLITTVAGSGWWGLGGDNGPATGALLSYTYGVALDAAGSLYIADQENQRIRKVSNAVITTVAGAGSQGDNGPAAGAQLYAPGGVAVDFAGSVYVADTSNNRIRKISKGAIATVAGNGTMGYGGDYGPATGAQLNDPVGVAVDSAGNLYIADRGRVRMVSNGVITTVAGNATPGYGGDNGPALAAQVAPYGVAVDSAGNLYIAEPGNFRIRKVSHGVITTVAGNGTQGFSGDGGPATAAQLNSPWGVAVDSDGNLYIGDQGNHRVRKVSNGAIATVAGSGMAGNWGDNGPATSAQLQEPSGVAVDSAGTLYIADWGTNTIRQVSNGAIATIAGNGTTGFSGDGGPAAKAQLFEPFSVAKDGAGNLYIADTYNNRVRELLPTPSIDAVVNAASGYAGAISPGEIVVVYGSTIGPAQLVTAAPGGGSYGAQLGGASVSFNGIAAPMIYAGASQTAAIVPYGISGSAAQVTVTYQGLTSAAFSVPMASSAPGVFTYDSTGQGPAAAINQDGVTVNTAATPTKIGDIISLYATGEGQTTPAGVDGKPASAPYPYPNLPVTATVGGQNAPVKYAGGAPGEVAGLMQVNVQIPAGIETGDAVPVVLRVGNAFSQGGVTIAVH